MFRIMPAAIAAFLLGAGAAYPQSGLDPVFEVLEGQGFTVTQTARETGRIRIQAQSANQYRELVYDSRTGALLSDDVMPLQDRDRDQDRLQDDTEDGTPDQDRDRDRDMDATQDMDRDQDMDATQDMDRDQAQDGSGK